MDRMKKLLDYKEPSPKVWAQRAWTEMCDLLQTKLELNRVPQDQSPDIFYMEQFTTRCLYMYLQQNTQNPDTGMMTVENLLFPYYSDYKWGTRSPNVGGI